MALQSSMTWFLNIGSHSKTGERFFYRRATQDNAEAKRKAFERARKELVQKGYLEVYDDVYLLKSPEAGQTGHDPDN